MNYVVKSGDSLSKIARDKLGDIDLWKTIARLNSIPPPYTIHPGQQITLPIATATVDAQGNPIRQFHTGTQIKARPDSVAPVIEQKQIGFLPIWIGVAIAISIFFIDKHR